MTEAIADPIPWAAPLTLAMNALKRAEGLFVQGRIDQAIGELRLAEENAQHCRYCAEAKR